MTEERVPAPRAPEPGSPAHRFGAPREAAVPLMETVRVTAPDLRRRAAMEITRSRLGTTACGFAVLFLAVVAKLAGATILMPLQPPASVTRSPVAHAMAEAKPEGRAIGAAFGPVDPAAPAMSPAGGPRTPSDLPAEHGTRAQITDRNGEILAVSLPTAGLFANPREMIDTDAAAHALTRVLPHLDEEAVRARLSSGSQFVYLARQISPREQLAINRLGIPGIYFQPTERRHYPQGRSAAQVLGGVDVDEHGVAGVERFFDERLREDPAPLRLSLDLRVQAVVRDELSKAMAEFQAIGACGLVLDVRTGEVLAMVSLPDYDANDFGSATPDERFNRAVTGMYEPGSTFKLQTVSLALDSGTVNIWNGFDASSPIRIGRFTISDFEGKHRFLYVPEIIAYSSNIGAAHMAAAVGGERQRAWLERMGMMQRIGIELPEAGQPLAPPAANWKEIATMTIGFGHGIAVSPLHVVAGTAAIANAGVRFRPTILAPEPDAPPRQGTRVMAEATSDTVRKLMRLVVTAGYGKAAEVPGYYVGGKTGTAEKVSHHGYNHNSRVSAFMSAFPMQAPRYAVYMMLDEPHADASTHGYATAGWVSAPAAGRVIGRIAPMLGLLPDLENQAAIDQSLFIPLQPGHPGGGAAGAAARSPSVAAVPAARPVPLPAAVPPARDLRHEASLRLPPPVPVSSVAGR